MGDADEGGAAVRVLVPRPPAAQHALKALDAPRIVDFLSALSLGHADLTQSLSSESLSKRRRTAIVRVSVLSQWHPSFASFHPCHCGRAFLRAGAFRSNADFDAHTYYSLPSTLNHARTRASRPSVSAY